MPGRAARARPRGLHPSVVTEHGLPVAVESPRGRPWRVEVDVDLEARLPEPIEVAAYFLIAESLTRVAK